MAGTTSHNPQRVMSVVAGTVMALACGTNYAYSAWAPQFAERLQLSATESNIIGVAGNLGMYASGIPTGMLTDARGPRLTTFLGGLALGAGYYPIYRAYENGPGVIGVALLSFFSFLTGLGSSSAFAAAIKTAASNYPDHRGTATAFPLAAFGLSALFWSTISAFAFKDDTGALLLLLAIGTLTFNLVSIPFLRILPPLDSYHSLSHHPSLDGSESRRLGRPKSADFNADANPSGEAGTQNTAFQSSSAVHRRSQSQVSDVRSSAPNDGHDETASLVSKSGRRPSGEPDDDDALHPTGPDSPHPDVRGLALLSKTEFWQLFLTMTLLSGIGLMTINNIGNDARALWKYYDDSATSKFIQQRQVMHVSILSFTSCVGRLLSGIGSDILVKKFLLSRFWCLFVSALVFTLTQLTGSLISNPYDLVIVSSMTGIAYGFLFGVFPSLVAHTFGIGGLSQNWGVMTLAPVFSGNIFNLFYGRIYDAHSIILPDGHRECTEGLACYKAAYHMTFVSGLAGIVVCLWAIVHENRIHAASRKNVITHDRMA